MGVKCLWKELDAAKRVIPLEHLENLTLAVDLSYWIVQFLQQSYDIRDAHFSGQKNHLRGIFHRVRALRSLNCHIIFIADGDIPAVKRNEYRKRREGAAYSFGSTRGSRAFAARFQRKKGGMLNVASKSNVASNDSAIGEGTCSQQSTNSAADSGVTRRKHSEFGMMVEEAKALAAAWNVPCITSPEEAEAQCALLNAAGKCDAVCTGDCDAFLFGARTVIREIRLVPNGKNFAFVYSMGDIEQCLNLRRNSLIALGLCLGSDYSDGAMPENAKKKKAQRKAFLDMVKKVDDASVIEHTIKAASLPDVQAAERAAKAFLQPVCHPADSSPVSRALSQRALPHAAEVMSFCERTIGWPREVAARYVIPKLGEQQLRRRVLLSLAHLSPSPPCPPSRTRTRRPQSAPLSPSSPPPAAPPSGVAPSSPPLAATPQERAAAVGLRSCPRSGRLQSLGCEVAAVVRARVQGGTRVLEVRWTGLPEAETSLVKEELLEKAMPELVAAFRVQQQAEKQTRKEQRVGKRLGDGREWGGQRKRQALPVEEQPSGQASAALAARSGSPAVSPAHSPAVALEDDTVQRREGWAVRQERQGCGILAGTFAQGRPIEREEAAEGRSPAGESTPQATRPTGCSRLPGGSQVGVPQAPLHVLLERVEESPAAQPPPLTVMGIALPDWSPFERPGRCAAESRGGSWRAAAGGGAAALEVQQREREARDLGVGGRQVCVAAEGQEVQERGNGLSRSGVHRGDGARKADMQQGAPVVVLSDDEGDDVMLSQASANRVAGSCTSPDHVQACQGDIVDLVTPEKNRYFL